jgi:hypothetical protein
MTGTSRVHRLAALACGIALFGAALTGPAGAARRPSKPDAPTITSVTAGIRSVKVTFDKPASNGGSRILTYHVVCTSSDGGAKRGHYGLRSPIKVTGLSGGKTYTCTVSARNKAGAGPASAPSASFVPTK